MTTTEAPVFLAETRAPMTYRFGCVLLDRDTENPPFEPARYFVAIVFAETKDDVLDVLGEEYPWCDIMFIDRMVHWGGRTDAEFLEAWLEYHDANNREPLWEAPHGHSK